MLAHRSNFFRHHHLHTHSRCHARTPLFYSSGSIAFNSEVGACSEDLVSQAAVVPDLVAGEHLEVLLEEPGKPQERLLVRGLVRPLHHTAFNLSSSKKSVTVLFSTGCIVQR